MCCDPPLVVFQLHAAGFGAISGHIGFDKLELTNTAAMKSHAYAHYLHHKYFEVNYGGAGLIPLDKWFGYWPDSTAAGEARMQARFEKKKAQISPMRRCRWPVLPRASRCCAKSHCRRRLPNASRSCRRRWRRATNGFSRASCAGLTNLMPK